MSISKAMTMTDIDVEEMGHKYFDIISNEECIEFHIRLLESFSGTGKNRTNNQYKSVVHGTANNDCKDKTKVFLRSICWARKLGLDQKVRDHYSRSPKGMGTCCLLLFRASLALGDS
jgi:hypothetical protein